MWIARHEQLAEPLFEFDEITFRSHRFLRGHRMAVRVGIFEHLPGGVEIAGPCRVDTVGLHQWRQLLVPLRHHAELLGVDGGRRVGETRLEFPELIGHGGQTGRQTWIDHGPARLPARRSSRS